MNALFNSALRQSNAIRKDLGTVSDAPATATPALQGQISASLTSFSRTIDEYNQLAKQELVPTKQEKAFERVKNFRTELAGYREQFDEVKKQREEATATDSRNQLLGRRPHHANEDIMSDNPYANASKIAAQQSPFRTANSLSLGAAPNDYGREQHAFREQSFMSQTNTQLDEFLDRGRAILGDLGQQKEVLKGTQRRLYGVANTLGVSGDTIRMIERRAKQDKWIFWAGVVIFFVFCYFVLKYLG